MMRSGPWKFGMLFVAGAQAWCSIASAQDAYVVDVPLTGGKNAVESLVTGLGGEVVGGTFSAQGWTTTESGDRIVIPLPAGIDATRGTLSIEVDGIGLGQPTGFFESYQLTSLDGQGAPFKPTPTGEAGIQTVFVLYDETGTSVHRVKGYFNLADATCTDWHDCTGESGAPQGWLKPPPQRYKLSHTWEDDVDQLRFEGPFVVNRTIDLSASSPTGRVAAPQLYWTINSCGGSTHNACGLWDGTVHGGPIGVRYLAAKLELRATCGDGTCTDHIETCSGCPQDCCTVDAGADAAPEAGTDANVDAAADAVTDVVLDAASDAASDAVRDSANEDGHEPADAIDPGDTEPTTPAASGGSDDGCGCRTASDFAADRGWAWFGLWVAAASIMGRRRMRRG